MKKRILDNDRNDKKNIWNFLFWKKKCMINDATDTKNLNKKEKKRENHIVLLKWIFHILEGSGMTYIGALFLLCIYKKKLKWEWKHPMVMSLASGVGVFRGMEFFGREIFDMDYWNTPLATFLSCTIGFQIWKDVKIQLSIVSYAIVQLILLILDRYCLYQKTSFLYYPFLLSLASGRVVYAWIFCPETFLPSHLKTLDINSAFPSQSLAKLRHDFQPKANPVLNICNSLHPKTNCISFSCQQSFPRLFIQALKVYIPLYLISSLFSTHKIWKRRKLLGRLLLSTLRSSLFLTFFYQIPITLICCMSWFIKLPNHIKISLAGAWGATSLLLEDSSKHKSIVGVLWMYAIITYTHDFRKRYVGIAKTYSLLFGFSMAILSSQIHQQNPQLVNLLYGYKKINSESK